jgi:hypothetical protein
MRRLRFFTVAVLFGRISLIGERLDPLLSVSLTLLQTICAAFVIVALYLSTSGRNTKRYEREHGIS